MKIDYKKIISVYLREMVKDILLSFDQNFDKDQSIYISFDINCHGVEASGEIQENFETTVVLDTNNPFKITNDGIYIEPNTYNYKSKLFIPFNAITGYIDTLYNISIQLESENIITKTESKENNKNYNQENNANNDNVLKFST